MKQFIRILLLTAWVSSDSSKLRITSGLDWIRVSSSQASLYFLNCSSEWTSKPLRESSTFQGIGYLKDFQSLNKVLIDCLTENFFVEPKDHAKKQTITFVNLLLISEYFSNYLAN